MTNPFSVYKQRKYTIIMKNALLFCISILLVFFLDQKEFAQFGQAYFWIGYNSLLIIAFFLLNFPDLKYLKKLFNLLNYFHTSESHSLDFVNLNLQTFVFPLNLDDENFEVLARFTK